MKKAAGNIGIILVFALWCLGMAGAGSHSINPALPVAHVENATFYSIASVKSLSPITHRSESGENTLRNIPGPTFKAPFNGLWAASNATDNLLKARFSQYISFSTDFPINLRKADFLFPFDYFW